MCGGWVVIGEGGGPEWVGWRLARAISNGVMGVVNRGIGNQGREAECG